MIRKIRAKLAYRRLKKRASRMDPIGIIDEFWEDASGLHANGHLFGKKDDNA